MSLPKDIIKFFIAGAVGGLLGSYISTFIPQVNMVPVISVAAGIGTVIVGIILYMIIKD